MNKVEKALMHALFVHLHHNMTRQLILACSSSLMKRSAKPGPRPYW